MTALSRSVAEEFRHLAEQFGDVASDFDQVSLPEETLAECYLKHRVKFHLHLLSGIGDEAKQLCAIVERSRIDPVLENGSRRRRVNVYGDRQVLPPPEQERGVDEFVLVGVRQPGKVRQWMPITTAAIEPICTTLGSP